MKKTLKELYKQYRSQIIVGIISSLLTAIIIALFHWIRDAAPAASAGILGKIVNLYYTTAARGTGNDALRVLASMLLGVFFALMTLPAIDAVQKQKEVKKLGKAAKALQEGGISKNENTGPKTNRVEDLQKDINDLMLVSKKKVSNGVTFLLFGLMYMTFFLTFVASPDNLYNRFQRDIIQIHPYVEEADVIILQSKWVSMRSKADYLEIYNSINAIKAEFQLP